MTKLTPSIQTKLSLVLGLLLGSAAQAQTKLDITTVGAVPDGTTLNTVAIQMAIDRAATIAGGATVVIPKGTFLSGSIFLKPGVNLHLEKDAVLKGTTDLKDYPLMNTRIEGHFQEWVPALINADKIDGLKITGEGTLDGSGQPFWNAFRQARGAKNLDVPRPRLLFIRDSKNIVVSGIHFKDSGFWNFHLYRCQDVLAENLDIRSGAGSPSCDGIDIDSCQRVTVKGCYFFTNDDCIALKGTKGPLAMDDKDSPPVEHIRVSDCTFERGNSFVTCGSEATIVRDVIVENCKAVGNDSGGMAVLRLKLRTDTPQLYEDMHFRNITLQGNGSLVSMAPWSQYFDLQGHPQPTRKVQNITMTNVKGTFGTFGGIGGSAGDVIQDVTFENIDVQLTGPAAAGRRGGTAAAATTAPATAPVAAARPPRLLVTNNLVMKNVKINGTELTSEMVAAAATQPAPGPGGPGAPGGRTGRGARGGAPQ